MSTLAYLISDSSEESSYESAQCSLQKTEKRVEPNNIKGKQSQILQQQEYGGAEKCAITLRSSPSKKTKIELVHKYLMSLVMNSKFPSSARDIKMNWRRK
ncbi:27698_t:CDS:1, partial [Racocetra persica]